jgi:aryl-alcohol dehydrogenase-like predicted oxidoreductase
MSARLALGTVQFGMPYGVANQRGQVPSGEVAAILERARASGIDTLQTAIGYGESERTLGEIGVRGWNVITKLPALPDGVDPASWARDSVIKSVERLRIPRLSTLLLHRGADLLSERGAVLYTELRRLRSEGVFATLGVSIDSPDELDALIPQFEIGHVQSPLNVVDRRLVRSGWLARLTELGIEVHARSLFLQGLLLLDARPAHFRRWNAIWESWERWLGDSGLTPLQACLGFGLAHRQLSRLLVGVDTVGQLDEVVAHASSTGVEPPSGLECDDPELVEPVRWLRHLNR